MTDIKYNLNFLLFSTSLLIILFCLLRHYCQQMLKDKKLRRMTLKRLTSIESVDKFTLERLAAFDGVQESHIYTSVKHIVFDVSYSPFYEVANGTYRAFNGKDISVNLAKMQFDTQWFN